MTNAEKFVEVFGTDLKRQYATKSWWEQEFVAPGVEKMSDYILDLEYAVRVLKKHCESETKCEDCIFYNDNDKGILGTMCYLNDIPEVWPVDKIFNKGE
jgi:hypothetical protein